MQNQTVQYIETKLRNAESKLSKKIDYRNKLSAEIAELEERVSVLQALFDEATKDFQTITIEEVITLHGSDGRVVRVEPKTNYMTLAEHAYQAMKQEGGTMHLKALSSKLLDEGNMNRIQYPEASLHSALRRRPDIFKLIGNGIWSIREGGINTGEKTEIAENDNENGGKGN